jgi:hypothetical protein
MHMETTMETPDPLGYQVFHMSKLSVHETEQKNENAGSLTL